MNHQFFPFLQLHPLSRLILNHWMKLPFTHWQHFENQEGNPKQAKIGSENDNLLLVNLHKWSGTHPQTPGRPESTRVSWSVRYHRTQPRAPHQQWTTEVPTQKAEISRSFLEICLWMLTGFLSFWEMGQTEALRVDTSGTKPCFWCLLTKAQ